MTRIGIVIGSPRKESFNRTLGTKTMDILAQMGIETVDIDFTDLPFINEDQEFPAPTPVAHMRNQVRAVDALWIFTPQYNASLPGYVKNFIDWLSRSESPEAARTEALAHGMPVTVSGISGPAATEQARAQVRHVAAYIGMRVLPAEHEAGLVLPNSAWSTGKYDPSEDDIAALRTQAQAFVDFISSVNTSQD